MEALPYILKVLSLDILSINGKGWIVVCQRRVVALPGAFLPLEGETRMRRYLDDKPFV